MRTLEKRLMLAIGLVVVLIAVAGSLAFRAIRDNIDTNVAAMRSRATLGEIQSTLLTLKDAEKVRNDQFLADDPHAVERLENARDAAIRKLSRLKSISAHDDERQQRLASAETAIHKRIDTLRRAIDERNGDDDATAEQKMATAEIEQTDELGRLLDQMRTDEASALDETLAGAESNMRFVLISFSVTGSLVALLLVLVFLLVRRDMRVQQELNLELERLATTDPLTGILNRRELSRLMAVETARATRYSQPVSLLTVDVDHFKRVNDTHGHQAGDEVLKTVVDRIAATIRVTDIVGRTGGEEFAVVLPNTAKSEAGILAERIRAAVASEPCTAADACIPVTVSIGVAEDLAGGIDTLVRADEALYSAKAAGRNRIAFA